MPSIAMRLLRDELARLLCFTLIPVLLFSVMVFIVINHQMTAKTEAEDHAHMEYVQSQMNFVVKELDALNLTFSVNSEITSTFARAFSLNDAQAMSSLKNICKHYMIPTVAAHDYIHSLYVYTPNAQNVFLSSATGPTLVSEYEDVAWLETYERMKSEGKTYFAERRAFKNYGFEAAPQRFITLYRRLYLSEGVIVLNLYQNYFDDLLKSQSTSGSQVLLVVNEEDEVLMQSEPAVSFSAEDLERLSAAREEALKEYRIQDASYFVTRLPSGNRYNWIYLSLTPLEEIHSFARNIVELLALILLPTLILCAVFAWRHAKTSCDNALRIVSTLEAAERHEVDLSQPRAQKEDFYGVVTERIVRNYAERNRLRYQLEQKQRDMREMELNALRSQINPHFLFNTLKSIYWMSFGLTGGPNEVSRMIEDMTEILEYSLNTADDLASLGDEIRNSKAYVQIQHMRYKERFEVTWRYDPELEKYYTVKLLFQPLIENAIMHGMSWNAKDTLHITITMERRGDFIEVAMQDDGVGIEPEQLERITSRLHSHSDDGHIGLYSCNKRLCLTFGEECGIRITSDRGTTLSMRFPCLTI